MDGVPRGRRGSGQLRWDSEDGEWRKESFGPRAVGGSVGTSRKESPHTSAVTVSQKRVGAAAAYGEARRSGVALRGTGRVLTGAGRRLHSSEAFFHGL